jgi:hypothetical protein
MDVNVIRVLYLVMQTLESEFSKKFSFALVCFTGCTLLSETCTALGSVQLGS